MTVELLRGGGGVEPWTPSGDLLQVDFIGTDLTMAVDRDARERARRCRTGLAAVDDRRTLQLMLAMSEDNWVPLGLFSTGERRLLRSLPAGVVDVDGGYVRRTLRPPLTLLSVGVTTSTWKQGFRAMAMYAPYCSRYVLLSPRRRLGDLSFATVEARYYGLGLAVVREESLDWLVSPAPFLAERFTASSWLMAEQVAGAISGRPSGSRL